MIHFNTISLDEYFAYRKTKNHRPIKLPEPIVDRYIIPTNFVIGENWPNKSPLRCWYCSLHFESKPLFIPTNINKKDNKIKYITKGNFCSFECIQEYVIEHDIKNVEEYIYELYRTLINNGPLFRNPIKIIHTKEYGGNEDISDFLKNLTYWN